MVPFWGDAILVCFLICLLTHANYHVVQWWWKMVYRAKEEVKLGWLWYWYYCNFFRTGKAEFMFIASYLTGLNSEFDDSHNSMRWKIDFKWETYNRYVFQNIENLWVGVEEEIVRCLPFELLEYYSRSRNRRHADLYWASERGHWK